jgi:hypothetical protein
MPPTAGDANNSREASNCWDASCRCNVSTTGKKQARAWMPATICTPGTAEMLATAGTQTTRISASAVRPQQPECQQQNISINWDSSNIKISRGCQHMEGQQ